MTKRGRITAIQPQKAHPDRVSLFVDDEYVMGIRRELAYRRQIRKGMSVTEEDLAAWQYEEACYEARELAVKYLTRQAKSAQQVAEYLARKGLEAGVIGQTIHDLELMGYLNDEEFAASFVANRILSKPRGKKMIRSELQQKGVSDVLIDDALDQYTDEIEVARQLISKKISSLEQIKDSEEWRDKQLKIGRFLMRKGFSASTVQTVIRELRQTRSLTKMRRDSGVLDND